ncbi:MAG: nucleotidyltransferase family protein [Proteiniphilum sp.]|nr:nucleotidyltransferase family protein [Proteiniphilum sp.]
MNDNKQIEKIKIQTSAKISEALRSMDLLKRKLLIVMEKDRFRSLLSIGDIQRAIIKGIDLNSQIKGILRRQISVASETDSDEEIKLRMMRGRSEFMPVVSRDGDLMRVVFWEDLIGADSGIQKAKLGLPVVIMAGGIGSRMRPLTNVMPKALIPIGEKSIIEQIMDSFLEYDCREYYLSINHKAEMIKYYFEGLKDHYGSVHYIEETDFWGTAGSIALLKDKIQETFFVSNCDILVDQDYSDVLDYHRSQDNEITIVAAMLNMSVPYGVLNTDCKGQLESISEKPELFYKINTGLYILEPSVFADIPEGVVLHITDLMESLIKQSRKVGVFPVSEKSWTDMGNWDEFLKQARVTHA